VDSATLRGARVVGILCALLLIAPILVSLAFPAAFFFPPYHAAYQRMLGALLLGLGLGLLLALRDPVRNAGVYAVIGLAVGSLMAAIAYTLVAERADPVHWATQVPLLAAVSVTLVVTYTRLRRPHPVVVRIVAAAVLLLPLGLYVYDVAYRAFVGR
jgi:O-antigen/teichoic acid export membrane protein